MLEAGGTVCSVSIATLACVRMRGVVLIIVSALCSCAVRHFCAHTWLMELVGRVGGFLVVAL